MTIKARLLAMLGCTLLPVLAQAHPGHDALSLVAGLSHPFTGLDHLFAMLAVGMWAAQLGGRMRWVLPLSFVSLMLSGAAFGSSQISLSAIDQGIAASVLVLGLLLAFSVRLSLGASAALVGSFALLHGYAHGAEAPTAAGEAGYFLGVVISTVVLHVVGFSVTRWLAHHQWPTAIRWVGGAMAVGGAVLSVVQ